MNSAARLIIPLVVAGAMPYIFTLVAKSGGFSQEDNKRTREWQAELDGWRKRAHWAHQNSFEGFPLYAAAVLCALIVAPLHDASLAFAWGYVATRIAYFVCYLKNWGGTRTIVWFCGIACCLGLFGVAALT